MTALQNRIQNRPLAVQDSPDGALPEALSRLVDHLFEQIFGANPNLRNRFPNEQALMTTKRQWVLGFAENGVNSVEQLRAGMRIFRSNCQWLPSLSEFISWCQGNDFHRHGLPILDEIPERMAIFFAHGRNMNFRSNAEYWLLSGLRRKARRYHWTEAELEKAAKAELTAMLTKLKQGSTYGPPSTKELSEKIERHDPVKALRNIAKLKQQLGVRQ